MQFVLSFGNSTAWNMKYNSRLLRRIERKCDRILRRLEVSDRRMPESRMLDAARELHRLSVEERKRADGLRGKGR